MAHVKEIINALTVGTVLNGSAYSYTIRKVLGQGTFGITYLASVKMSGALGSLDTEVLVAIKEFFMKELNGREDSTVTSGSKDGAFAYYKSKFIHEAENLSSLKHPNIIKVVESFEENNTAYYAMEYIEGGSLDDRIAKYNGLSELECINYACQIGKALEYMHSQNMLHLDLKPNNIMLHKNGQVVLIDFGLAKQFGADGKPETSTTIGHGTPGYAPIEQANYREPKAGVFPASMDIYAFGATIFKMLTGHRPPEASSILNDGFPFEEFDLTNISKRFIEIISTCMDPMLKNRYTSMTKVIEELLTLAIDDTDGIKGFYKKWTESSVPGVHRVNLIPVTSSIKFPSSIKIRLWDNSKTGQSFEIYLTDKFPMDGDISLQNSITVWNKGKVIKEESFCAGIPSDVREYIIKNGLLSTVHWENEEITSIIDDDFGTDVTIQMTNGEGEVFTRRVKHAHIDYHAFLLDAVSGLIFNTSLVSVVNQSQEENPPSKLVRFKTPSDTKSISVRFKPARFGYTPPEYIDNGYYYSLQSPSFSSVSNPVIVKDFNRMIQDFNRLNIEVGDKIIDDKDYSEKPGELVIEIESKSKGLIQLSLVAFNTDMQAGNIYNTNINDLAESIQQVILKYLPKRSEPTIELIYSIPDTTSEIWIDYSEAGAVGLAKNYQLRIGNIKNSPISSNVDYSFNPQEFSQIVSGLRDLQLHSQFRTNVEMNTGEAPAMLTISLYDNIGNCIKKFYAEDVNGKCVGDTAITVGKLKNEIIKISPSFKKLLNSNEPQKKEEKTSISTGIIVFMFFSLIIGPTYFFVNLDDKYYWWLWSSICSTELFTILFTITEINNNSSNLTNTRMAVFILGTLSLFAYIILWICQMCSWWL